MSATERLLLRPDEAANAIGVSRAKIYDLIARRQLPSVKVGCSIRVPVGALKEWIDAQLKAEASEAR